MRTNRFGLLAATLVLVVSGVQGQTPGPTAPAAWKLYTIGGEDFSVALPNLPARHTNDEYMEELQKSRRIYSVGAYADGVVYVIYVVENPKSFQSLETFIKNQGVSSTDLTDITLDGFSGKKDSRDDSQYFATKDRLYQFMAMGAPLDDPRITTFFSSVSLHQKKDSLKIVDGPGLPYEPPASPEPANANADPAKQLFTGKEVQKKVRLGMKPEPSYTEDARKNAVTGTVVLKCVFRSNGSVTDIRLVTGLPYGLSERAIDAARKIKFIPAIKDGKFVSMWMQLEYNFNLY
jgi:TonB family protein